MSIENDKNVGKSVASNKNFSKEFIKNLTRAYLNTENDFVIEWYSVKRCEEVVGFQGEYYKMVLDVSVQGKLKRMAFFIKSLPAEEEKAKKLNDVGYFNREFCVYTKIFSMFDKVQNPSKYHPKCALSSNSNIILEDMSEKGYRIMDSRKTMDTHHCLIALKSLSKFHGASFILEERMSKEIGRKFWIQDEFADFLNECGYKYEGWYIAGIEAAFAAALLSEKYGRIIEENKELWHRLFKAALKLCCPSTESRNVLCHRDLWANNLMFNYDESNLALNCVFVDFQACRCMPLAGDVASLIYLNMSRQDREKNFDDLVLEYFKELSIEIESHNLKINTFLKWDAFRKDCEKYKLWGLVQCMILHQLALLKKGDVVTVLSESDYNRLLNDTRSDFIVSIMNKDSVYKTRMMESIEEFVELFISNQ